MKVDEYLIKDVVCITWPATVEIIYLEAIKSNYHWFLLTKGEEIIGCIKRNTLYDQLKAINFAELNSISIENLLTDVSVVTDEEASQINYDANKVVVVIESKGKVKGVIDWEFWKRMHQVVNEDEWIIKEMQTVFDEFYQSIFVTDDKGNVIRVSSYDDQQHLGKNVFDLERERVFYPSITAKVIKSGKRESGLQYTNTGEMFQIDSIPIKNELGEIVRVVSITKHSSEIENLKKLQQETKTLFDSYQREVARIKQEKYEDKPFIYKSKAMEDVFELIKSVSSVDTSVLILGETGVGKQMVANQIHLLSHRNDKPFVTINCGAIPENLLESELFGYEEGAFSGTRKGGKLGLFQIADKGTIFLDEIGEMPVSLQVKLLRVLQEKVILKVGGTKEHKIDVRIISATNKDLSQMIKDGSFREDLYYRINVVPIRIPALKERKDDIEALVYHFLDKFNKKYQKNVEPSSRQLEQILNYSWPGNVRELENAIERMIVLEKSLFFEDERTDSLYLHEVEKEEGKLPHLTKFMETAEKGLIMKAMSRFSTTREMANSLGVNQSTIVRKLQKYGLRDHLQQNDI
ncbi:sigma-54 interaction domain-containing protein [Neobacillus sp. M.A.Huq-85]